MTAGDDLGPPLRSDVTVQPGSIRDFARFLDEMSTEIATVEATIGAYTTGDRPVGFGHYDASPAATTRHATAVSVGHHHLDRLHTRTDEVVEATWRLARQYADLEDLNRATAAQVTAELTRKRG